MLRQIMLNKKKRDLQVALEENAKKFEEIAIRESELETDIEAAKTEEEQSAVEEEVTQFEKDKEDLKKAKSSLEEKIAEIDAELAEIESKEEERKNAVQKEVREIKEEDIVMRDNFGGLKREAVLNLVKRDDVKEFLTRAREMREQRSVKNADLLIPEILIGILRDNIHVYSKLINKVALRQINGKGRMIISGTIPEAIWVEACASLKELSINFNEIEVDEYKVGGYIPICNSTLEDASDVNLFNEIMYALAQAIGLALDKAILYGTGKKMPLGIVTRLAQTLKPDHYPEKARDWEDLSKKNILKCTGDTAQKLFADITLKSAAAKPDYSNGNKFWCMNDTTYTTLKAKLVETNAAGVVVSSISNIMPVIGGEIIILPFIPDNDIIGGYSSLYVLAERAGITLATSEHVQFIEDNTVFKGTARYDGLPAIAEGFVVLNINNLAPTTTISFQS